MKLLLFILLTGPVVSYSTELEICDTLKWCENKKISWNDFVVRDSGYGAMSALSIMVVTKNSDSLAIEVFLFFNVKVHGSGKGTRVMIYYLMNNCISI